MNNHHPFRARILPAGLVLAACLNGAAVAQDIEDARDTGDALEEIVVTAERRTTSLQDAAVSADVLSGELMDRKGIRQLLDLQYAAPALVVSDYGSANVTTIRGIGRSQVDIDVPSGVVIYRDGAPTFGGYFQNEPYFDMESVEVLRGPQGTFVGQSAAGGAIFINTNDPELGDEVTGSMEVGAGNYDRIEATGIVNIPVSDTFAVRAAYKHDERSDFWDAITGDFTGDPGSLDNHSFRLGLLWQPNDKFRSTLKTDYHDLDFGGSIVYKIDTAPLSTVEQNGRIEYKDQSLRSVLEMGYFFDNGIELRSLSNFQTVDTINHLDLNATDPQFYQFLSDFSVDTWSQEINLISPADEPITYVLGLFYQEQEVDIPYWQEEGFAFIGGVGGGNPGAPPFVTGSEFPWLTSPWFQNQEFAGVFAHVSYELTDSVTLEGGIRYNDYHVDQFTDWTFGFGTEPPTLQFAPPATQSLDQDYVDGQVVVNWNMDNGHFVYGLVSRGHNTGGINIFPPFRSYGEMQVINYEGGWKTSWLGDRFRTQFSAYYQTIDDYQANFAQEGSVLGNIPDNRAASDTSTIWGIELSGQARINNWSVDFSAAYMDSELGTFENVFDPFLPPDSNLVDLTGAEVPFAPETNASLGVGYEFLLAGGYALSPRVDVYYQGKSRAALWRNPLTIIDDRTLVNAQAILISPSDRWETVLWVNNAADRHYTSGIQNNGTLRRAGSPREYGLRLQYFF